MGKINRKTFFDGIRSGPFPGKLNAKQVQGCTAILDEWERRGLSDARWLAYMLGTVKWETDHTMQPIPEVGKGRGRKYGARDPITGEVYYGRGFVQLTWKYNYETMTRLLKAAGIKADLVANPDLAMRPDIAAFILFEGMIRGSFTGKKLSQYFSKTVTDWINARRIINGTDRAALIAGISKEFYADLRLAGG